MLFQYLLINLVLPLSEICLLGFLKEVENTSFFVFFYKNLIIFFKYTPFTYPIQSIEIRFKNSIFFFFGIEFHTYRYLFSNKIYYYLLPKKKKEYMNYFLFSFLIQITLNLGLLNMDSRCLLVLHHLIISRAQFN